MRHPTDIRAGPPSVSCSKARCCFELEGQPPRVIRAGEAFWEPGGDVIHYSDGNNRDDVECRFTVTMLCVPGKPMLELVDEKELEARKHLRVAAESSAQE